MWRSVGWGRDEGGTRCMRVRWAREESWTGGWGELNGADKDQGGTDKYRRVR